MEIYTRSQIRAARQKWAEFLMEPERKLGMGGLDRDNDERCCLGHGCFVLGVRRSKHKHNGFCNRSFFVYGKKAESALAPEEFCEMVGLWNEWGASLTGGLLDKIKPYNDYSSLASANDSGDCSPQEIGAYLLRVIEGGKSTPFTPLSDYPD